MRKKQKGKGDDKSLTGRRGGKKGKYLEIIMPFKAK
jgi:hypothetical protein